VKDSQSNQIEKHIRSNGYVTRNWCLQRYISRLSAIIFVLIEKGYEFDTKTIKSSASTVGDFCYTATKIPEKPIYEKE